MAVTFKMAEKYSDRSSSNFALVVKKCALVKLEHSAVETVGMIQKAVTMGNW